MSRFKQAMYRFFAGRYGVDALYRFSFVLWLILSIVTVFTKSTVLYALELILMGWMFFRCLSRNVAKRAEENRKFLAAISRVKNFFRLQKNKWKDRKTHSYRRCPSCRATLRFPKVKGKHSATCPRCKTSFDFTI